MVESSRNVASRSRATEHRIKQKDIKVLALALMNTGASDSWHRATASSDPVQGVKHLKMCQA